ncbi:MAG: orotidine-5'-phosphate decarboxylase [Phycisphaerales bacterium]|nr:MAG: orotidine-5'-phosphate decarboxylase [Phycisphaerales bacterium]
MNVHFGDRLVNAIREKNAPACVGFDPLVERFPTSLLSDVGIGMTPDNQLETGTSPGAIVEALLAYGREVIHLVAPYVPAVKINIAFFERYGADGVRAYFDLVKRAREAGLVVIGDVKRADIGHSTTQYAHAHLGDPEHAGVAAPDAVTVNPYFGFDAIRPFIDVARDTGRGLFVLVQTSNASAAEVQNLTLSDGSPLCHQVAKLVQTWAGGEGLVGSRDYSCIGAVVSPRDLESTERIRALMPNCIFLVPGFGAQGRTADEVAKCFKADGTGAIVNASRSVIYAYREEQYRKSFGDDWRGCIEQACKDFVGAIRTVVGT